MGTEKQLQPLSYSVRPRVVIKFVGQLSLVLAVLSSVTLAFSVLSGEFHLAVRYGAVVAAFTIMGLLTRKMESPSSIQGNEALSVAALIFIITSVLMTYPMMASGLSLEDAFFESVSAVTTTGLSTLPTVEDKPMTFLFSRAWLQWSGGLGIVVLSIALLIGPGTAAKRLALTDIDVTDMVTSTRMHARRVLVVYLVLTVIGVTVLTLMGTEPFVSLVHTMAAVSTGGFSSYDESLAGIGSYYIRVAVIVLCFLGAVPLALYYRVFNKGIREILAHVEFWWLVLLCLISSVLLFFLMTLSGGVDVREALRNAPIMAFSAQTTAGFSTIDMSALDSASKLAIIISMAIGGNVGSTAGGIKVFRILVMLRLMKLSLLRTFLPGHAVVGLSMGKHRMEGEEIERVLVVILFFLAVQLISWFPFVAMGYDPLDSLFEVVSATGTVGLSAGVTASQLPPLLKGVLCVDMLMGRLEILAILIVIYPRTWLGRRYES